MRSRFAAFSLGDAEYLWRTLHSEHEDRALPKDDVVRALKSTSSALKFMRLTIVDAKEARVLFLAAVFERGQDRSFLELSTFEHDGTGWRYLTGTARSALDAKKAAVSTIETFLGGPPSMG
jgi:SEC-C motif-containing protein